jgi:hypothetical protein
MAAGKFAIKPRAGALPFAFHRPVRDTENFAYLNLGQTGKEPQFHDPRLTLVDKDQPLEGGVDVEDFLIPAGGGRDVRMELNTGGVATSLASTARTRRIDEHTAHRLSGCGEEMRPIGPVRRSPTRQTQVCFMNEGRGLQRMVPSLRTQASHSDPTEFVIEQLQQTSFRRTVTSVSELQQTSYFIGS